MTSEGKEEVYRKSHSEQGRTEYRSGTRPLKSRPDKIFVVVDAEDDVGVADVDDEETGHQR